MKNKTKNQTPSTSLLNDSNNLSSYLSKEISYNDIKKDSVNKYHSNSLDELTKKFTNYVYEFAYEYRTNLINLNDVMKKIKAKKRRIYDITNVLEGNNISLFIII